MGARARPEGPLDRNRFCAAAVQLRAGASEGHAHRNRQLIKSCNVCSGVAAHVPHRCTEILPAATLQELAVLTNHLATPYGRQVYATPQCFLHGCCIYRANVSFLLDPSIDDGTANE